MQPNTPLDADSVPPQRSAPITVPWRVGHRGRDEMYYEEWRDGAWQRIVISGEMLTGRAHHVIYFDSPQRWLDYPEWARPRRDEIIGRIKSEFRPPDYDYHGDGPGEAGSGVVALNPVVSEQPRIVTAQARSARGKANSALLLTIALLLGLTAVMSWLVGSGVSKGETFFPSKRATQRRSVVRQQEPVTFWISIGLYSAIGVGALGFAGWLVRETCKQGRRGRD